VVWAILYSLIPLGLLAALVAAVVLAVTAWRRRPELDEGIVGQQREALAKRLYFYAAAFASLTAAAVGLSLVLAYVLDTLFGPVLVGDRRGTLALGLVLLLVWGPSWLWHWGRAQAFLGDDPTEASSLLRQGYLLLALVAAVGVTGFGMADGLRQAFGAQDFRGLSLGLLASWGGVWAYHLWLARWAPAARPAEAGHGFYLHLVSLGGLAVAGVGAGLLLSLVLQQAYDELFGPLGVALRRPGLWQRSRDYLALLLTGALLLASHWPYARVAFRGWWLRHLYLYLFALLGGAVTCLVGGVLALDGALAWALDAVETSAREHFRYLTGVIPTLLLGGGVWAYHWLEVREEQSGLQALAAARRTYGYLMAMLGLGALAAALIVLAALAVNAGVEAADRRALDPTWWRGQLALGLALGLVGAPAWGLHWWQRQARAAEAEEQAAVARRLYVRGMAVASLLAALGGLSHFLYLLLDALLEARATGEVFRQSQWSLGVAAAALAFGPYHWLVMREDGRRAVAAPPAPRPAKAVTVLVPQDGDAFVQGLEEHLGARVRVLRRADPGVGLPLATPEALAEAAARVAQAAGERVLVVADAEGVRVYSY
jgi:hypothetical protein